MNFYKINNKIKHAQRKLTGKVLLPNLESMCENSWNRKLTSPVGCEMKELPESGLKFPFHHPASNMPKASQSDLRRYPGWSGWRWVEVRLYLGWSSWRWVEVRRCPGWSGWRWVEVSQQRRWLQGCGSWLVRQRGLHARWSRSLLLGHLQSQRHQHSCQAGPGPRGPWRHCLLIKLRPGSKHSSSAASPPARLQTRVKPSTARGRGLEAPWRHSARGGSTGAPTLGLSGSNPPSTAGATGFRPCSADTPHAKEQPSPSPATTGPAQLRKPPRPGDLGLQQEKPRQGEVRI